MQPLIIKRIRENPWHRIVRATRPPPPWSRDGSRILSSVVASQLRRTCKYGGVVPELASREHLRAIVPAVRTRARTGRRRDSTISRHRRYQGPGLVGSLLVGITYAKALGLVAATAADRRESHRRTHPCGVLEPESGSSSPPSRWSSAAATRISSRCSKDSSYRLLGKTRDDAAGEAFDKVAKLLGFGYPGGPVIDLLAPHGNPRAVRFTLAK